MDDAFVVTTVRLTPAQYRWIRALAFRAALKKGGRPDASEIIRQLVDAAMNKE